MKKNIVVQKLTSKQGQSSRTGKVFTKYGLQDATGTWYNSFNMISAKEGGEYEIEYEEGQYGNDLKSIKPLSVSENQAANVNRQNSIIRQHSQNMALMFLTAQGQPFSLEEVKEMTDWFDKDVEGVELPFV